MKDASAEHSREGELVAGKYRLEKLLGSGGVGVVYKAQNTLIGRTVALKLLRPEHAFNEVIVGRFMREARAANIVRHPNVVDVLDIGQDDKGVPFIVQELLEGEDLGRYIKKQPGGHLGVEAALDLLIPVIEAVGLAHSRGIVHRDLKPENVFLSRVQGKLVPKLLDFGISHMRPAPGEVRMTATGVTLGTPAFMSPEQIEGTIEIDARTDVWALGVILYEVLAGRLPFEGDTHATLFVQIVWVDPKPLDIAAPHVPHALAQVVARCLRRDPDARYPTAAELARDLIRVRSGEALDASDSGWNAGPIADEDPAYRRSRAVTQRAEGPSGMRRTSSPRSRAPSGSLNTPRPQAVDSARPRRTSSGELLPLAATLEDRNQMNSGISLATLRPPPPTSVPLHSDSQPDQADGNPNWRLGTLVLGALALATMMLLLIFAHQPTIVALEDGLAALFDPAARLRLQVMAAGSLIAAVLAGTRAWTSVPRSWGPLVITVGLGLIGITVAGHVLRAGDSLLSETPAVPWGGLAVTTTGVCVALMQRAWTRWCSGVASFRIASVTLVITAAALLFLAIEVIVAAVS